MEFDALNQFRSILMCLMPDNFSTLNYIDYGCYCGKGGSGTPVDQLDRCCQVHDDCYGQAIEHSDCRPILDNPYTELYDYSCDYKKKTVTCGPYNNECEMFICECDRKAAECFGQSPWIAENEHLPSDRCQ
ncbi:Phospholipase A2 [Liparis tanakae]|uniref:Phospholipase A2 n=1 Tax=Liparis tanakae TaxID=230148 RepID=A0A4Z2HIF7_9TELE|nr:Phospholipase A2 [Liparis tanakae]